MRDCAQPGARAIARTRCQSPSLHADAGTPTYRPSLCIAILAGKVAILDVEAVEAVTSVRQQLTAAGSSPSSAAAVSIPVFAVFVALRRAAPPQQPQLAPAAGAVPVESADDAGLQGLDAAVTAARAAEPDTFQVWATPTPACAVTGEALFERAHQPTLC